MKGNPDDTADPKGLIAEAYRIEGVGAPECRSIFLDWALSLPEDLDQSEALQILLERHGAAEDHPMTAVLLEGQVKLTGPRRRGGWKSRRKE